MADSPNITNLSRRTMFGRIPVAALATTAVFSALTVPADAASGDRELVRLGVELEAAWTAERALDASLDVGDDAFGVVMGRTRDIVHQIEVIPATSLAGLQVKARAILWCHSGEPIASDAFNDQETTDIRLAASIVRDLLASRGST